MGAILAKFRRKQSTRELLEKIQSDLDAIDEFKRSTQASHKKVIGYLLTYFTVLYFLAALVAYFKYFYNPEWQDLTSQLQLLMPFLLAPLLFMIVKNLLTWWYHRKIRRNEVKAEKLKKEKASLIEKVMETETYKVAKEILEKFGMEHPASRTSMAMGSPGPNTSVRLSANSPAGPSRIQAALQQQQQGNELRRRHTASHTPTAPPAPTLASRLQAKPSGNLSLLGGGVSDAGNASVSGEGDNSFAAAPASVNQRPHQPAGPMQRRPPGPPLPRPVLPRERGYMDRVVEYLVGDGPANRFALICRQCQSHNGMALKEEFEYIAYRCCYCYYWNPARKQRPVAPKLTNTLQKQSSTESTSEEEEEDQKSRSIESSSKAVVETKPEVKPDETDSDRVARSEVKDEEVTAMETSEMEEDKKDEN